MIRVGVLERRGTSDVRIGARAEPFRQLAANLQLDRRAIGAERLQIGVGDDELDAVEARAYHPVDGVAAAASDADDLDSGRRAFPFVVER